MGTSWVKPIAPIPKPAEGKSGWGVMQHRDCAGIFARDRTSNQGR